MSRSPFSSWPGLYIMIHCFKSLNYSSSFPSRRIDTDFSFSSRKKLVMKYSAPGSFYQPSEALDNLLILTELLRLCVTPVSPHAHPLLSCSHGPWKLSCPLGVSDCSARMMSKHNSLTPHVQCSLYWCNAELHSYMGPAAVAPHPHWHLFAQTRPGVSNPTWGRTRKYLPKKQKTIFSRRS